MSLNTAHDVSGVPRPIAAIQDGSIYRLAVDADTESEFTTKTDFRQYGENTSVISGATVTLLTYTVGAATDGRLQMVTLSGDRGAKFIIKINGTQYYTVRINGPDTKFKPFERVKLATTETVSVEVTNTTSRTGSYEATIEGYEV